VCLIFLFGLDFDIVDVSVYEVLLGKVDVVDVVYEIDDGVDLMFLMIELVGVDVVLFSWLGCEFESSDFIDEIFMIEYFGLILLVYVYVDV